MKFCPHCGQELMKKQVEGKDRLACPSSSCTYVFWDNPTPVVAAIVELDGTVILARNKLWPEKMFGLVTGFLEKGETPASAVLREVKEELGLTGTVADFIGIYSFLEQNQLIIAYHVGVHGTVTLGEEIAEVRYVSPERLKPWPFGTGYAVKDWLERRNS